MAKTPLASRQILIRVIKKVHLTIMNDIVNLENSNIVNLENSKEDNSITVDDALTLSVTAS